MGTVRTRDRDRTRAHTTVEGHHGALSIGLLAGGLLSVLLAWPYQTLLDTVPLIYVRFIAPLLFGLAIGFSLVRILVRLGCHASNAALVLAIAIGTSGDVASFAYAHARYVARQRSAIESGTLPESERAQRIEALEHMGLSDYLRLRVAEGFAVGDLIERDRKVERDPARDHGELEMPISGDSVWAVWCIELIVILLGAAVGTIVGRPSVGVGRDVSLGTDPENEVLDRQ